MRSLEAADVDRHLEHSLLYALIELSWRHPSLDLTQLAESDSTLGAAFLVLDQAGQLVPDRIGRAAKIDLGRLFEALKRDDDRLWRTAAEVLAKQTAWAAEASDHLDGLRRRAELGEETAVAALRLILGGWKGEPSTQVWLVGWMQEAPQQSAETQRLLADLLPVAASQNSVPAGWVSPLAAWLTKSDPAVRGHLCDRLAGLETGSDPTAVLAESLIRLAQQSAEPREQLRLLAALPTGTKISDESLEALAVETFGAQPISVQDGSLLPLTAKLLTRARLSQPAVMVLVESLARVPPQYLTVVIEAVHRGGHDAVSEQLLTKLVDIPAAKTLPQDFLVQLFRSSDQRLRELARATTDALLEPAADIRATVDGTLAKLGPGDPVRGLQVFRGSKAQCSACHRMGYVGKDVGPVLTRIGGSRTPEALLEAILFPSARQEQSYQATRVLTVDGRIFSGLIQVQTEEAIEMQLDAERRMVIPRDEIEELAASDVSVMPSGVAELLSLQELADLMALLRSTK